MLVVQNPDWVASDALKCGSFGNSQILVLIAAECCSEPKSIGLKKMTDLAMDFTTLKKVGKSAADFQKLDFGSCFRK